jgi:hypothetical protein
MAMPDRKPHSNLMMAHAYLVWHVARISSRTPQNLKAKVKKDLKGTLPACGHNAERGRRDVSAGL